MPRKGGKKKKGKVVRADRDSAAVDQMASAMKNKLASSAVMHGVPGLDQTSGTARSDSRKGSFLDESQYTYYSEYQSTVHDQEEDQNNNAAAQEYDVRNLRADLEAAEQEESKQDQSQKQILTSRG